MVYHIRLIVIWTKNEPACRLCPFPSKPFNREFIIVIFNFRVESNRDPRYMRYDFQQPVEVGPFLTQRLASDI